VSNPVVIFAANRGYALTSSRTHIIRHFLNSGWQVVLATADDAESRSLCKLGARLEPVSINRGGLCFRQDLQAYSRLVQIYRTWQPKLVQHFHAKPVILGSLAAKRTLGDRVQVVNTITGLGNAFVTGGMAARLVGWGYAMALPHSDMTIFQNKDDKEMFLQQGWTDKPRSRFVPGSGVDVNRFEMVKREGRDNHSPVVIMLGRLLRQKGIPEFIEVAQRVQSIRPQARFLLAGEEDPVHPDSVTATWIKEQGSVEYLGRLSNVVPLLNKADLLLFPSYYREGLPRVILEASATGLPTVAFNVPGVREAVRNGKTGYLVEYCDLDVLTQRVKELLENPEKRLCMGRAAREMVVQEFDIRMVNDRYLSLYRELGVAI
jgi:glycosyltransferase involved in cell wall biosynthesis